MYILFLCQPNIYFMFSFLLLLLFFDAEKSTYRLLDSITWWYHSMLSLSPSDRATGSSFWRLSLFSGRMPGFLWLSARMFHIIMQVRPHPLPLLIINLITVYMQTPSSMICHHQFMDRGWWPLAGGEWRREHQARQGRSYKHFIFSLEHMVIIASMVPFPHPSYIPSILLADEVSSKTKNRNVCTYGNIKGTLIVLNYQKFDFHFIPLRINSLVFIFLFFLQSD